MTIAEQLKAYIQAQHPRQELPDLDRVNLIESQILDSLAIMKLIAFIEKQFGVKVASADITPRNFGSIDAIVSLITTKLPPS